ncbi:MFS transporter [Neolewinella antarctica]|uniref:MFS family permease n=1 Tax=Neolewinella antarctica TaxID=442734 RepID=A0ABX0XD44_9BACT|nr:MFS transporter [Neolewinella antarctica]NJC27127.1 MFS family permease [Neolewinella antarctica]
MPAALTTIADLYVKAFTGLPRRVWWLSITMLVNRSGAMVVAFLSVYLINDRGFAPLDAGYVMAAFGAGGVLGNYIGGLLNDRYGSWHIMVVSLFGSGLLHIWLAYVTEFWALCALTFVISVVADAFRPANRAAIAIYAPPERLTQSYGLQRMAANLGFSIGPALGGFLIYKFGYSLMFWGDGITFILAGLLFLYLLPKDETAIPLVSKEDRDADRLAYAQGNASASKPAFRQFWLVLYVLANTCIMLCFFNLFSVFSPYLNAAGYDERIIGLLFTISGVVIVAFEMPVLYVIESRFRLIKVMLVGGAIMMGSFLLLPLAVSVGFLALAAAMILLSFGEILYMPLTNAYLSKYAPPARRGEYLGVLSASYSLAFIFAQLIGFGVADKFGYAAAIYASCAVAGAGIGILSIVNQVRIKASPGSPGLVRPLPSSE